MGRLIDADKLLDDIRKKAKAGFPANKNLSLYAESCVIHAPTVDAVSVVRCKECKWFSRDAEYNRAWCNYFSGALETAVNGYCYHGEWSADNG